MCNGMNNSELIKAEMFASGFLPKLAHFRMLCIAEENSIDFRVTSQEDLLTQVSR